MHVDPDIVQLGGYKKPIMHGLCFYGITARVIYDKYCNKNPLQLKKLAARFTSHVFPGETFIISFWKEGKIIIFESKTKERGKVVLVGYAKLREIAKL